MNSLGRAGDLSQGFCWEVGRGEVGEMSRVQNAGVGPVERKAGTWMQAVT